MDFLITNIKKDKELFFDVKRELITEAINFPMGKTVIGKWYEGIYGYCIEASFLKPGKETRRKEPNIYDMYPMLKCEDVDVTEKFTFEDIWEYLLKIYLIHKGTFLKILVLLYRLCYFYDHNYQNDKWRYSPSDEIFKLIYDLDTLVLRDGFADKFKELKYLNLLQFILFVDLLSWNEDVKYHAPNGEPYFRNITESKTGRTNTILSIISAPLLISKFIEDIVTKTQSGGIINVRLITTVIQKFTRSRGLCVLSDSELQSALAPYLRG